MLNFLKFHHTTRYDRVYAPASTLYSQKMIPFRSRLIACCKVAPTLARQIWHHNDVIGRNEYLISTLSESTFPWVYSLQFLFKSTHHSCRYERKCEWVFYFWTQCIFSSMNQRECLIVLISELYGNGDDGITAISTVFPRWWGQSWR